MADDLASRMYPDLAANSADAAPAASSPAPAAAAPAASAEKTIAERMFPKEAAQEAARPAQNDAANAPKAAESEAKDTAAVSRDTRTEDQIDQAATQLVEELSLDAADPMSGTFAKEAVTLGLDKAGAEKMAQLHYQHQVDRWQAQRDTWREEALAMPNARVEIAAANSVLRRFGDPKIGEFLAQGYGDNPALVRFLSRIERALRGSF